MPSKNRDTVGLFGHGLNVGAWLFGFPIPPNFVDLMRTIWRIRGREAPRTRDAAVRAAAEEFHVSPETVEDAFTLLHYADIRDERLAELYGLPGGRDAEARALREDVEQAVPPRRGIDLNGPRYSAALDVIERAFHSIMNDDDFLDALRHHLGRKNVERLRNLEYRIKELAEAQREHEEGEPVAPENLARAAERGLERLALQVQRRDRLLEAWPAWVAGLPDQLIPQAEEARSALREARFAHAETIITDDLVAALCNDQGCGDRALQAQWLEVAAEICRADFRYRRAADRFAQADERLSDADRDRRPFLRWRAARALLDAAWEFGDIDAAERARESFEGLAGRAGRRLPAGDRLRVTLEFGEAYLRLARLRGEPADLAEARDILTEVVNDAEEIDDKAPLVIDAKAYLGLALHWLGEWTADPDACRRAVEQFEAVLGAVGSLSPDAIDEDTRRRVRSMLYHQVGLALTRLGERESGDAGLMRLDEALTALDRAIADRGAEYDGGSLRDRRGWAESSNARLVTLLSKAERTGDTGLLWQACAAAERVLKHRPRERVPLQWAATEANRGNVLAALARQTGERDLWRDAIAAYRAALECFDRDKTPLDWATTSGNLGIALLHTAEREDDLVGAECVLADASSALSTERAPIQYGIILNTLGGCRAMLADARGDRAAMEDARATFEQAAATFTLAGAEAYRCQAEANIARAGESLAAMA